MKSNQLIALFSTFVLLSGFISACIGCRPDWDNQCDRHEECCSGYCHRDNPNWKTGVCKRNNGPQSSTTSGTTNGPGQKQSGEGECSWYGADGEIPPGSYTSCGQIFDRDAMTAAQLGALAPKLPCGTRVRVTNKANGKTVDVVINDSGSHQGRILDLTYAAFGKIENRDKGVTPCSYVVL